MLFLFFVASAESLTSISEIQNFVFTQNESYDLLLGSYFSGDYMEFSLNSSTPYLQQSTTSTNITNLIAYPANVTYPFSSILPKVTLNEQPILLIPVSSSIYFLHYNSTYSESITQLFLTVPPLFVSITSVTALTIMNELFVLIGTLEKSEFDQDIYINQFYVANLTELLSCNCNYSYKLTMWDIYYASVLNIEDQTRNIFVGNTDCEKVPIIIYMYDRGQILLYDFSDPINPSINFIIFNINLPIEAVVLRGLLYVITATYQVYSISISDTGYSILNTALIDSYAPILSMQLSYDLNSLILTTAKAFIIVSIPDFSSAYLKFVATELGFFHGSIETANFISIVKDGLAKTSDIIIAEPRSKNLLTSVKAPGINLQWHSFEVNETAIDYIIANETSIYLLSVVYNQGLLKVGWNTTGVIEIKANESTKNETLAQVFSVIFVSSKNNSVYYTGPSSLEFSVNIDNLVGTLVVFCNQLFSGEDLVCGADQWFFNPLVMDDMNFTLGSSLEEFMPPMAFMQWVYSSIALYGIDLVFYNSTNAAEMAIFNESPTNYEFPFAVLALFVASPDVYAYVNSPNNSYYVVHSDDLNFTNFTSYRIYASLRQIISSPPYVFIITQYYTMVCDTSLLTCGSERLLFSPISSFYFENFLYVLTSKEITAYELNGYQLTSVYSIVNPCPLCTDLLINQIYLIVYNAFHSIIYDRFEFNFIKQINFTKPMAVISVLNNTMVGYDLAFVYLYNLDNLAHSSLLQSYEVIWGPECFFSDCQISLLQEYYPSGIIFLFCEPCLQLFSYNVLGTYIEINGYLLGNASTDKQTEVVNGVIYGNSSESSTSFPIQISFVINGLTIFENKTTEDQVVSFDCNQPGNFNLDGIITGQNITFTLQNTSSLFSIQNRVQEDKLFHYTDVILKDFQVVPNLLNIGITDDTIYLLVNSTVYDKITMDNETLVSLQFVNYIDGMFRFLVGSVYNETVPVYLYGRIIQQYFSKNLIRLWAYNSGFTQVFTQELDFSPDQIRVSALLGYDFFFAVFNAYESDLILPNISLTNYVQVCYFKENKHLEVYPFQFSYFNISSIYISDISAYFDPMFQVFYLYFADINYGIRIFSFKGTLLNIYYKGLVYTPEAIIGLEINGGFLYAAGFSTSIYYYKINDFTDLSLINSILYINNFEVIYGTLTTSDSFSPIYIAQLIYSSDSGDTSVYLQLIDLTAPSFSAILAEKYLGPGSISNTAIQFTGDHSVSVLFNGNISIFNISEGKLNYYYSKKNCKSHDFNLQAVAHGTYIDRNFSIKVKTVGVYGSGNIGRVYPPWAVALTIALIVFCIVGLPVAYKIVSRRRRRTTDRASLFQYDFNNF